MRLRYVRQQAMEDANKQKKNTPMRSALSTAAMLGVAIICVAPSCARVLSGSLRNVGLCALRSVAPHASVQKISITDCSQVIGQYCMLSRLHTRGGQGQRSQLRTGTSVPKVRRGARQDGLGST